jgi:hypothetical protein
MRFLLSELDAAGHADALGFSFLLSSDYIALISSVINAPLSRMASAMAFGPIHIQEAYKMWDCLKTNTNLQEYEPT